MDREKMEFKGTDYSYSDPAEEEVKRETYVAKGYAIYDPDAPEQRLDLVEEILHKIIDDLKKENIVPNFNTMNIYFRDGMELTDEGPCFIVRAAMKFREE